MYSKKWNWAASFLISTLLYLWAIYVSQNRSTYFTAANYADRPCEDTMDHRCINVGMGTRLRSFISGNFFLFSEWCLCSADLKRNRVVVRGETSLHPPPPLSTAGFWTYHERRREKFFLHLHRILALWWRPVRFTSLVAGLKRCNFQSLSSALRRIKLPKKCYLYTRRM